MTRRKISTTVYLDPRQDRDLKALREKTGKPMAQSIREAIDRYLEEHRDQIPVPADDPRQAVLDFDPWPDKDTGGFHQ